MGGSTFPRYSAADGSLTSVSSNDFMTYAFSYDALKRLSSRYNFTYKQSYTDQNRSDDSTKTTTLVSKLDYSARSVEQTLLHSR